MTSGPPPVKEGLGTTTNEDGSVSELIAVSKHLVGKLIGKAGTTIQQLQQSTATNIQIDQVRRSMHACPGPGRVCGAARVTASAAAAAAMRIASRVRETAPLVTAARSALHTARV
jgi:predicted PilT family ATPase